MAAFAGLALLPDIDVLGVALGLPDEGALGHRGFTHSFLFAALIALFAAWVARRIRMRALPMALLAFVAVASHGILDALTYDSRGTPLLWPLSDERVVSPWRPIPSAPTGLAFVSSRGGEVALLELIYFAPIVLATFFWQRWGVPGGITLSRAALRSGVIGASVMSCLLLAELVLRDTQFVSSLEAPMLASVTPGDARRLRLPRRLRIVAPADQAGSVVLGRRPRGASFTRPSVPVRLLPAPSSP